MIAGHFGRKKTREAIRRRLDWPGIATDVKILYQSCLVHQKSIPSIVTRAPLHSLPILKNLFLRLAMDIFGPLKNMRTWKKYILIAMDYTTKWPKPLHSNKYSNDSEQPDSVSNRRNAVLLLTIVYI